MQDGTKVESDITNIIDGRFKNMILDPINSANDVDFWKDENGRFKYYDFCYFIIEKYQLEMKGENIVGRRNRRFLCEKDIRKIIAFEEARNILPGNVNTIIKEIKELLKERT